MELKERVDAIVWLAKGEAKLTKLHNGLGYTAKFVLIVSLPVLVSLPVSGFMWDDLESKTMTHPLIIFYTSALIVLAIEACSYIYGKIRMNKLLAEQVRNYRNLLDIGEEYRVEVDIRNCEYRILSTVQIPKEEWTQETTIDDIADYAVAHSISTIPESWYCTYTKGLRCETIPRLGDDDDTLGIRIIVHKSFHPYFSLYM